MKHKNFINLQLYAGNIVSTTIIFDSHITKVKLVDNEWTTSGQTIEQTAYPNNDFVVTLQDGYVLETVMATNTFTITNLTETTFRIDPTNLEATETTITLTSKLATATKSYDLSTSSKWASLADGEHQVTIVAKADGYKDSNASSAVTVTKSASTYTLEAGTYKFVDNPSVPTNAITQSLDFVSDNKTGTEIQITKFFDSSDDEYTTIITYQFSDYAPTTVRDTTGWRIGYQTIILSTAQQVSAEFYNWAITNGNLVKQGGVTGHTLTFTGVTVTVDGVAVTSPYTLNKNCTIVASSDIGVSVNGDTSIDTPTMTLSDTDIVLAESRNAVLSEVTINYAI